MQISGLVDAETANLAASVAPGSAAYLVVLSPEARSLLLCIQNGQSLEQVAKNINVPEEELRAAATEAVRTLASYAVALRKGRSKAAREAGE